MYRKWSIVGGSVPYSALLYGSAGSGRLLRPIDLKVGLCTDGGFAQYLRVPPFDSDSVRD